MFTLFQTPPTMARLVAQLRPPMFDKMSSLTISHSLATSVSETVLVSNLNQAMETSFSERVIERVAFGVVNRAVIDGLKSQPKFKTTSLDVIVEGTEGQDEDEEEEDGDILINPVDFNYSFFSGWLEDIEEEAEEEINPNNDSMAFPNESPIISIRPLSPGSTSSIVSTSPPSTPRSCLASALKLHANHPDRLARAHRFVHFNERIHIRTIQEVEAAWDPILIPLPKDESGALLDTLPLSHSFEGVYIKKTRIQKFKNKCLRVFARSSARTKYQ